MEIIKVCLNDKEISIEEAESYIYDYMTLECLYGGIAIILPQGVLQAEVRIKS